jgi:hypothetical protein
VRSNQLTGRLPTDMHTLSKLKELDVGHNAQLGGPLPAFAAMADLTWLRMNDCQLSGGLRGLEALAALKVVRLQVRRRRLSDHIHLRGKVAQEEGCGVFDTPAVQRRGLITQQARRLGALAREALYTVAPIRSHSSHPMHVASGHTT